MDFGTLLKVERKQQKLSQRDLASMIEVDFTYISKIENGILPPPSEEIIEKMAGVLQGDSIEWLLTANRIPADFEKLIIKDARVASFLRKASAITEEQWKQIEKIIG